MVNLFIEQEANPFIRRAAERDNPFIRKAREYDAQIEEIDRRFDIKIPDTPAGMLELLEQLSDDELEELFKAHQELERRLTEFGPQDDDELHSWIKAELGIDIPRTSVCEDHDPPFDLIADLYFERVDAVLAMGNRGGGKTMLVAILHWLNSLFKPGCESCTFGATEAQSLRCYAYIKGWIYTENGEKREEVISSLMRETIFANSSRIEILPGTPAAVNGPHPQKAHADEIELMDDATWKESRNMTMSKRLLDGRFAKPQDICTSTRKGPHGRMQKLINEISAALAAGFRPPRKLYQWCIKETASQVPNCQVANPDLPDDQKCQCHKIRKGDWDDGSPRLLRDICAGDFFRSRGWQPFDDVIKQFTENDQETFEVQQLCLRPEMHYHYLPKFDEAQHCFRNYEADPNNGPIYTSTDWGGTNPHAVNWYQFLKFEIEVDVFTENIFRKKIRIPKGSVICFDEIYKAEIGNTRLGYLVKFKEASYRRKWGERWHVEERFADPQGKAAKLDWKSIGLYTKWHVTREFEEHIKVINDLFDDNAFYIAADKCPMWVREAREWRRNPTTGQQIDTFNHCFVSGTPILTAQGEIPIEDVRVGDLVQTRAGFRRVSASGITGFSEKFIRLCVGGRMITCTPNHLIYTKNMGWTRADRITAGTVVLVESQKSNLAASSSDSMNQEDISALSLDHDNRLSGFTSIAKFGNPILDPFLKVMTCITDSRMIKRQLIQADLNYGMRTSIAAIMQENDGKQATIAIPMNIDQRLVPVSKNESKSSGVNVVKNLNGSIMGECAVESVERVVLPCQPVYDLTVEDQHEFYAVGVLVHNCMSNFRYAVANIAKLHKLFKDKPDMGISELPVIDPAERKAGVTISIRKQDEGPLGFRSNREDEFARWRGSLGQPVRNTA